MTESAVYTNLDAAFDATDDIWDNREAYIRAVFEAFNIPPDAPFGEKEYVS